MKKILFIFVCLCVLMSCSQDDDLLVNEPQEQTTNEEGESIDMELRGVVEDFFDSRNQIPLYEYLSYSGSTIVNVYYSIEDKGASFTDSKTNQVFTSRKKICTIAGTPPGGYNISMPCLQLLYNTSSQTYSLSARTSVPYPEGHYMGDSNYLVKNLGFVIDLFYSMAPEKFDSGAWGYLTLYYNRIHPCRRAIAENRNSMPSDPNSLYGETLGAVGLR